MVFEFGFVIRQNKPSNTQEPKQNKEKHRSDITLDPGGHWPQRPCKKLSIQQRTTARSSANLTNPNQTDPECHCDTVIFKAQKLVTKE